MTTDQQLINARTAHIGGGIPVARVLPTKSRRTIGAWCFLDHAGPAEFNPGEGMRVGPHPHIGLQTFTWMIEGEVLHLDSLGSEQIVRPGQINLMTAGIGISHTEECLDEETKLHAAQLWIALPPESKDVAAEFNHYPTLPSWQSHGSYFTLLAGSYDDYTAPTKIYSPLIGLEILSQEATHHPLALNPSFEYGVLVLEGEIEIEEQKVTQDQLIYLGDGRNSVVINIAANSRVLLVGGEPLKQELIIWWNYVGYSKEDISKANQDWIDGSSRFGEVKGFEGPRLDAPPLPW